jgi:ketosteroid isomerase-like protein
MVAEHEHVRVANVTLVRRFIEAINDSWNVDVMRELVSDDFLFMIPFAPEWFQVRYEGKENALGFLNSVRDLMDPENLHDVRDRYVFRRSIRCDRGVQECHPHEGDEFALSQ